jgi:UTP--glucose-1-phosphate uridylyltransferase
LADDLIISHTPAIQQLIDVADAKRASVVAVLRVPQEEVGRYGVVQIGRSEGKVHEVLDLVEKPRPDRAPSNLAVIGRYVLSPRVFPILQETAPGAKGEIQLTDALQQLAKEEQIYAIEFEGVRHDTGEKLGFLKATVEIALDHPDLGPGLSAWLKARAREL